MIKILNYTSNPLTVVGQIGGICYGANNPKRFKNIAKRCLAEGHGRVSEFADITIEISGYSAKFGREIFTHIIGTSRVQSSTRYIDYAQNGFGFVIPTKIEKNPEARKIWDNQMRNINKAMLELKDLGIPTEDYTNLLPLAYETTIVLKINLRALIHMFHVRACTCAYWEYRNFMQELKMKLSSLDEEWKFLCDEYFVPKCIASGYCEEVTRSCNIRPIKK